jgi:hypothetical protein
LQTKGVLKVPLEFFGLHFAEAGLKFASMSCQLLIPAKATRSTRTCSYFKKLRNHKALSLLKAGIGFAPNDLV